MAVTANYRCPRCTGPLHFGTKSGKLECEYCGSSFTIEEMEKLYAEQEKKSENETKAEDSADRKKAQEAEKNGSDSDDSFKMKTLNCQTCGAKLFTDENTVASSCPYCGNPTIIPGQFTEYRKPEYVIPFKFDKKQAVEALKNHYNHKKLLPDVFKTQNHLEDIKGIYVPFWLFDATASADIHYSGTRTFTRTSGKYTIIRTDHYKMERAGTVDFEKIPVDASVKMDNDMMDSIEPFEYNEIKSFKTAYLPGFLAESYDDSEENCESRLKKRAENSIRKIMTGDLSIYATTITDSEKIDIKKTKTHYALLPVWLLTTKWNGGTYLFAMNGQTGKFVGNLPCDGKKFFLHFLKFFLPAAVIAGLIFYFLF